MHQTFYGSTENVLSLLLWEVAKADALITQKLVGFKSQGYSFILYLNVFLFSLAYSMNFYIQIKESLDYSLKT